MEVEAVFEFILFVFLFVSILYGFAKFLRHMDWFNHVGQLVFLISAVSLLCLGIHFIFGDDFVKSIGSGLAIGFGIAIQPIIKHIVNGFVLDGTKIRNLQNLGRKIKIKDVIGDIHTIGLIHTWILGEDGSFIMFNNDVLEREHLVILPPEPIKRRNDLVFG
jgi:hypothetical protein